MERFLRNVEQLHRARRRARPRQRPAAADRRHLAQRRARSGFPRVKASICRDGVPAARRAGPHRRRDPAPGPTTAAGPPATAPRPPARATACRHDQRDAAVTFVRSLVRDLVEKRAVAGRPRARRRDRRRRRGCSAGGGLATPAPAPREGVAGAAPRSGRCGPTRGDGRRSRPGRPPRAAGPVRNPFEQLEPATDATFRRGTPRRPASGSGLPARRRARPPHRARTTGTGGAGGVDPRPSTGWPGSGRAPAAQRRPRTTRSTSTASTCASARPAS